MFGPQLERPRPKAADPPRSNSLLDLKELKSALRQRKQRQRFEYQKGVRRHKNQNRNRRASSMLLNSTESKLLCIEFS